MNIDIITIWPRNHDYPVFRRLLKKYASFYNKAICVMNGSQEPYDFAEFIKESTDSNKVLVMNGRQHVGDEDWRNVAVNEALAASAADYIWFLEQDFFFKDADFIDKVYDAVVKKGVVGFWEAGRLHPACLLIKRDIINKTHKDFSVNPQIPLDHFGMFSKEVVTEAGVDNIVELKDLGLEMKRDWFHMQGLTHNYNLVRAGDTDKIFMKDEFLTYNDKSVLVSVPQNERYLKEVFNAQRTLGEFKYQDWLAEFI